MGGNYQRIGKYSKAVDLFQKGLAVLRKVPGVDSPSYSISLIGLAYLETDMGNYSVAEKVYDEADGLLKAKRRASIRCTRVSGTIGVPI